MTARALLIYGASGYVGALVARAAVGAGLRPILAGREALAITTLGRELELDTRVFGLDDAQALAAGLAGVDVVLNCAGPFARTLPPLLDACIAARVHYLDLSGEVDEHELAHARHEQLERAGVLAMPGVGFGVVPTELLARLATELLPDADELDIVYDTRGGASRGTLASVLPLIHRSGVQRRAGAWVPARPGEQARELDLGEGPVVVVTNPWRADLLSAYLSTGVPNISTYASFPALARGLMKLGWLLDTALGRALIGVLIRVAPRGPSEAERARGSTACMAEARKGSARVRVYLRGPEAYAFTVELALAVARHVLAGAVPAGFHTPAQLLGASFLAGLPGVEVRRDAA